MLFFRALEKLICDSIKWKNIQIYAKIKKALYKEGNSMKKIEWGALQSTIIKRIELWLRQFSIYKRLITVMLIVSIVPIMIIGGCSITMIYHSIRTNYVDHIQSTNEILSDHISLFIQDIESFGTQLLYSATIRQSLASMDKMTLKEQVVFIQEVDQIISQNYSLLTMAADISILNSKKEIIYAQGYRNISSEFILNGVNELENSDKKSYKKSFVNREIDYIGIVMKINTGNPYASMGYLFIAIEESQMESILSKGMLNGVGGLSLIDLEGNIIASVGEAITYDLNKFLSRTYLKGKYFGTEKINYDLISYEYVDYNDWYLLSKTPEAYIASEVMSVIRSLVIGILILILVVSVISFLLWKSITRPLQRLISTMKSINTIDLTDPQLEDGNDEMTYLYKEFNIMIQFIKDLIADMKETNENQRKLELKMLQAQINPHFLFNTLNSIKWMAEMLNVKPISDTIGALSRLLRGTISDTNEKITIDDELQNVKDYITIQRNRYGDSFSFQLDLDVECLEYKITKFILQPIVENSLLHGLNEREDLAITIKVRNMLDWIYIYVEDNGAGFDVEAVLKQKSKEKLDGKLSSIGMINVIERVNLCYQSEGDIKIISEVNKGTVVIIKIPKQL